MSEYICCKICKYPHIRVDNGIQSITVSCAAKVKNSFFSRIPIKYETSIYKDKEVCHLCWQEIEYEGKLNFKRLSAEKRIIAKWKIFD